MGSRGKIFFGGFVFLGALLFFRYDFEAILTEMLKSQQLSLSELYQQNTSLFLTCFFFGYLILCTFSLPGGTVLTVAGGALFGMNSGFVLTLAARSLGAVCAFLLSRYLLKPWVLFHLKDRVAEIYRGLNKDASLYLFSLRVTPGVPFSVLNLVMGTTTIPFERFFLISILGLAPGTWIYTSAGVHLAEIERLRDIFSPMMIGGFLLLAAIPVAIKRFLLK